MDKITRRRFLTLSGVTAAGALAYGATQVDWSDLMRAAETDPLDANAAVLVLVTLYGGNDGLNTIVPAGDRVYQDARNELAYDQGEVLDLGDGLGLNPGMRQLKGLWDERKLAVVRGVGYPRPDRSHFRSMAIWQTASPDTSVPSGWLGRWLDTTGDDPLRALSVEPVLPPVLAGVRTAGASLPVGGLALPGGSLGRAYQALGGVQTGESAEHARAAKSIADLHRATDVLTEALRDARESSDEQDEDETRTKGASAGGTGALGAQLDVIAGLVEAGVPTRAYSASLGGFDTHADERVTQERLLGELDGALGPFARRMAKSDRGRNVVVLVYSEFGRRVAANGSDGTDHGTAGPLFLLGTRVTGGFHGEQPSLTDLDNGDLKATTDFRDVYATVLEQVLGTDAGPVLGDHPGRLTGVLA
ncbi:DUF1501 domain-containing protein [Actinokineospora sp.]|uniref:DUF1501 domain-containing protein n=1 Tax=Actinokineospora sp. TaxID=1872133 RepID=UPI0040376C97